MSETKRDTRTQRSLAQSPARRTVRTADLVWLSLRQHRVLLGVSTALTAALAVAMLLTERALGNDPCAALDSCPALRGVASRGESLLRVGSAMPVLVAVFWGAPALPREIEQGTTLLAWGQDVSPARWLRAKIAVLGTVAALLALLLWAAARPLTEMLVALRPSRQFAGAFAALPFEMLPPLLVPQVVLGLMIGIAAGTLARRTVPAIATAFAAGAGTLVVIARLARPRYVAPSRSFSDVDGLPPVHPDALVLVQNAWADSAGRVVGVPSRCLTSDAFQACLAEHGVVQRVTIFQPPDRLAVFQTIETVLLVALAAGCAVLAILWLRTRYDS